MRLRKLPLPEKLFATLEFFDPCMLEGPTQSKLLGASGPAAAGPDADGRDRSTLGVWHREGAWSVRPRLLS